jgi:hypothetical protein
LAAHYTTTKTTKVYIHYENVLNQVAATSAAASYSILYPKKIVCVQCTNQYTTKQNKKQKDRERQRRRRETETHKERERQRESAIVAQ